MIDQSPNDAIDVGLSLMLGGDFWKAALPLFGGGDGDNNKVDVVEWSFDMGWGRELPSQLTQVLLEYSNRGKLLGHGVSYSALDASETARQDHWLSQFAVEIGQLNYQHVSEHFGFMGGGNFHFAAPMPVPRTETSIAVGRDRLKRLADVAGVPVGLENLAFAFGLDDVRQQGPFLKDLLEPVEGFLLLDLHNIYCQSCNFEIEMLELIDAYPLDRVRELHVSGGSWSEHPAGSGQQVRRDTHDDAVPEEIFKVIPAVLDRCKNVEAVILERLDGTIDEENDDVPQFRTDFHRLRSIVGNAARREDG